MNAIMKRWSIVLLGIFYLFAGANHFWHPDFYYPLIPDYLPQPLLINYASGVLEILLGTGVLYNNTRKYACYGIIALLLLFIPSHVWFIQKGGCMSESFCVPVWVAWVRLLLVHPLLMYWAYAAKKK
jgi:uncharacterized membrane protein